MTERKPKHKYWDCEGCCALQFAVTPVNKPVCIDPAYWAKATAAGEVCGRNNTGSVYVSAQTLVPFGVYTLWFLTDVGLFPAAPVAADFPADGYDPNRLVVNGTGALDYYLAPLDFNPYRGIPTPSGLAQIRQVVFICNSDRTTHGRSPGTLNVTAFSQLVAPFCYPRETDE